MTTDTRNRNIIIAIVVFLALACCCIAATAAMGLTLRAGREAARNLDGFDLGTVPATTTFSQTFDVDAPAQLQVDLGVGSLTISAGEGNTVQVDATVTAYGVNEEAGTQEMLDNLQLTATQSGSSVKVVGRWSDPIRFSGRSPQIDMRITIPVQTDLVVDLGAGTVEVTGIEGNADIKADVGQVTLRDLDVPEHLTVESNVAEISYSGSLNDGSEYRLTSDVGAVQMQLPQDSRFAIDAVSELGAVIVEFDVVGETTRELTGASAKGVVGDASDTLLYLRSNVGAIYVREQ